MRSMKCEFVNAGDEAIIYGSGFSADDEIFFKNNKKGEIVASKTNDSVLTVIVPEDVEPGMLCYVPKHGNKVYSDFMFRDNRGTIIDFAKYPSTWGGFEPFDEEGEPIKVVANGDSILTLPVTPPEAISGHYGLLYGIYKEAWTMKKETFLQYCAKKEYGGRGNVSIAGDTTILSNRLTNSGGNVRLSALVRVRSDCLSSISPASKPIPLPNSLN